MTKAAVALALDRLPVGVNIILGIREDNNAMQEDPFVAHQAFVQLSGTFRRSFAYQCLSRDLFQEDCSGQNLFFSSTPLPISLPFLKI